MADQNIPNGTPMLDTEGTAVLVPSGQMQNQLSKGYKLGTYMTDGDGHTVVVGHDRFAEAMQKGYKVGPAAQQPKPPTPITGNTYDENGIPQTFTQPEPTDQEKSQFLTNLKNFGGELGSTAWGLLKTGIPLPMKGYGPMGAADAITDAYKQVGPQAVEQLHNKQYAQAAVSGGALLDPFATPSIAQINELQKQGKGQEAASRGLADILALGTGLKEEAPAAVKTGSREALASLIDSRANKVDVDAVAGNTLAALRNEASKQKVYPTQFRGREGGQLGVKIANDAVNAHEATLNQLTDAAGRSSAVDMRPVAQQYINAINEYIGKNEPELRDRLIGEAQKYNKTGTLNELNEFREFMNKELGSYYRKGTSQKIMSDPEVKAAEDAVQAARKLQYEFIGNKLGIDPASIKEMMDREGHLIEVASSFEKEYNAASKDQARAKAPKTAREYIFGVSGKPDIRATRSSFLQRTFGVKPIDALNYRLKSIFEGLGPYQTGPFPPNPGGVPPIGPNRPQLPPGQYNMGPSGLQAILDQIQNARNKGILPPGQYEMPPGIKGLLPESTGTPDVTLHQPSLETPSHLVEAGKMTGRDVKTGKFKKGYTTSPREPIVEEPQSQHPGVVQNAKIADTEQGKLLQGNHPNLSEAAFRAQLQDINGLMERLRQGKPPVDNTPVQPSAKLTPEQREILEYHAKQLERGGARFVGHDEVARQLLGVPESMTEYWKGLPEKNRAKVIREFLKSGRPFGEWTEAELKAGEKFTVQQRPPSNTPEAQPDSSGLNVGPLPDRFKPIDMSQQIPAGMLDNLPPQLQQQILANMKNGGINVPPTERPLGIVKTPEQRAIERRANPRPEGAPIYSDAERIVRSAGFDTGGIGVNKELGTITFFDKAKPNRPVTMKMEDVVNGGADAVKAKINERLTQQEAKPGKTPEPPAPKPNLESPYEAVNRALSDRLDFLRNTLKTAKGVQRADTLRLIQDTERQLMKNKKPRQGGFIRGDNPRQGLGDLRAISSRSADLIADSVKTLNGNADKLLSENAELRKQAQSLGVDLPDEMQRPAIDLTSTDMRDLAASGGKMQRFNGDLEKQNAKLRDSIKTGNKSARQQNAVAKASNLNSPQDAGQFLDMAAQEKFQKNYNDLTLPQKLSVMERGGELQRAARRGTLGAKPPGFSNGKPTSGSGFAKMDIPSALGEGAKKLAATFFSKAQRVAEEKLPNKMPASMVEPTLRNAGVPEDQLRWIELPSFLEGKKMVSKDDVLSYIKDNDININETHLGRDEAIKNFNNFMSQDDLKTFAKKGYSVHAVGNDLHVFGPDGHIVELPVDVPEGDWPLMERSWSALEQAAESSHAKYTNYTTPGGKNNRELLLSLNESPNKKTFKGGHYGSETSGAGFNNVLAHVRFNDRFMPDENGPSTQNGAKGYKTLHIEEVQSDWHQRGRDRGYLPSETERKQLTEKQDKLYQSLVDSIKKNSEWRHTYRSQWQVLIRQIAHGDVADVPQSLIPQAQEFMNIQNRLEGSHWAFENGGIVHKVAPPDAPLKKTWHEFAMKRMLRYAAENGYDRITWNTGEQQADRYSLAHHVDKLVYDPHANEVAGYKDGQQIFRKGSAPTVDGMAPIIGRDPAQKLVEQINNHMNNIDMKGWNIVEAPGTRKTFGTPKYHVVDPNGKTITDGHGVALEFRDKSSAKFEIASIQRANSMSKGYPSISGFDLRVGDQGMKGFYDKMIPNFLDKYGKKWGAKVKNEHLNTNAGPQRYVIQERDGWHTVRDTETGQSMANYSTREGAEDDRFIKHEKSRGIVPVHSIDITPQMKHDVLHKGQPISDKKIPTTIPPKIRAMMEGANA